MKRWSEEFGAAEERVVAADFNRMESQRNGRIRDEALDELRRKGKHQPGFVDSDP